ncbi:MAG: hypothetical protein HQ581_05235 [Planctomycetes bacterium]|nr:hypothetical protein [Planctomycetota bacterium]
MKWRFFQFRLRTLFLFTMALAIFMSWVCIDVRAYIKQEEARERFDALESTAFDKEWSPAPGMYPWSFFEEPLPPGAPSTWVIKWLIDPDPQWITGIGGSLSEEQSRVIIEDIDRFPHLTSFTASGFFDEADMLALAGVARLDSLDLRRAPITDEAISALADCPSLRYLDVSETAITGAGLAEAPQLPVLDGIVLSSRQAVEGGRPLFERLVPVQTILVIGEPVDTGPVQFDDDALDVVGKVLRPTQRLILKLTRVTSEHLGAVKAENPELTIERKLGFPHYYPGYPDSEIWILRDL